MIFTTMACIKQIIHQLYLFIVYIMIVDTDGTSDVWLYSSLQLRLSTFTILCCWSWKQIVSNSKCSLKTHPYAYYAHPDRTGSTLLKYTTLYVSLFRVGTSNRHPRVPF